MAGAGGGKIVNRQGLAEVFGVSLPTVNAWVRSKAPYIKRGGKGSEWQFDTAAVMEWRIQQASEASHQKLLSLEAIEKETARVKLEQEKLKLARAAALVVPMDQMERRLAIVFAEIRTNMRNLPSRVASVLLGETNERRIRAVLLDEIDRNLSGLADFDTNTLDESVDDAAGSTEPQ